MPTLQVEARFPPKLADALFAPKRYLFLRGGRGSGKSWAAALALLVLAMQRRRRVLCAREIQKSIRESVHQLLRDTIERHGLGAFYEVLTTEIRGANGSLFSFAGLSEQTAESIKSYEGYDLVWLEEAQSLTARSLSILIPTIRREGSEIWATYNPQLDTDPIDVLAVKQRPPGAITVDLNWSDNPWFPAVLEQERLHAQATMRAWEYGHVWEGRYLPAVEGAIYADEIALVEAEGRLLPMKPERVLCAHAVWDLGWNDSTAIVIAQKAASEIRIVDYVEGTHRTVESYALELQNLPLTWGHDWLPHDGFATSRQTGKTDSKILEGLQRFPQRVPNADLESGIRAARALFPRVWFNSASPGVMKLVEHLRRYRRVIGVKTGEPGTPLHDAASHGADAFRYLALAAPKMTNNRPRLAQPQDDDEYAGTGFIG